MSDIPVACSLSLAELVARRGALLPGLTAQAHARETLPQGFRWRFAPSAALLERITQVIDSERQCCPFLRFDVTVEGGDGAMWLAVTGPTGTRELLEAVTGRGLQPNPQMQPTGRSRLALLGRAALLMAKRWKCWFVRARR